MCRPGRQAPEAKRVFPDMEFRVDLLIASGDLIVSNWTLTGTHGGEPYCAVAAGRTA